MRNGHAAPSDRRRVNMTTTPEADQPNVQPPESIASAATAPKPAHHTLVGAELCRVVEALLLVSEAPLSLQRLDEILSDQSPGRPALQAAVNDLVDSCAGRP